MWLGLDQTLAVAMAMVGGGSNGRPTVAIYHFVSETSQVPCAFHEID